VQHLGSRVLLLMNAKGSAVDRMAQEAWSYWQWPGPG
jgi:hypothetical protein